MTVENLGHGVTAQLVRPAKRYQDDPDVPHYCGAIITREGTHPDGSDCSDVIYWWRPPGERGPVWELRALEPLEVHPSVQCAHPSCTFHGFIRAGRWQPV